MCILKDKPRINKKFLAKRRLLVVFIILALVFLGIMGRLGYVMIAKGQIYKVSALKQWTSEIKILPTRGKILDRNGNTLAVSLEAYRVDVDMNTLRQSIKSKMSIEDVAVKLAGILNVSTDKIADMLYPKNIPVKYATIARKIDKAQADKIKALKILGIIVSSDSKRSYQNDNFLAGVLGHINSDGNGVAGVEATYNKELLGVPGKMILQKDVKNNELPYDDSQYVPAANGKDLILTIDQQIQQYAEQAAQKALTDNKAKSVTITIMSPNNGEVLAMVNKPDYNPNNPNASGKTSEEILSSWKNNAVQNTFEPGSIFKVITSYAGMVNNVVDDNTIFQCNGSTTVDGKLIHCWDWDGHGTEHFVDIIKNSCNVGFIELGQKIGKQNLYNAIKLMGFGQKTGIDLPGEAVGIVRTPDKTTNVDLANNSFGQGLSVTSVEYLTALNAVANGGTWIRPHVMKEIVHSDSNNNQVIDTKYTDLGSKKILDTALTSKLRQYLVHVVSDTGGVGHNAYIDGLNIAGKTGTAQKADPKTGGYAAGKYMASFAGMAPADNPQITMLVSIDEPDPAKYYAGQVAAPVAGQLYDEIFKYLALNKDVLNK